MASVYIPWYLLKKNEDICPWEPYIRMVLVALFVVSKNWEYPQMSKNRGPVCKGTCYTVLSRFNCVHLWVTLWTVVCQAPLSVWFSIQEYWSRLPCPPPEDLPNPGMELMSPALAGEFFTTEPTGKPTKILELQHQSFQWIFRVDFL